MEDWALFDKIKNDDQRAFDELFKKYYHPLVVYIVSHTNDVQIAEDIVQNIFVSFWSDRHQIKIAKTVKGYLYWVSYTAFLDHYRKIKRRRTLLNDFKEKALREAIEEDPEIIDVRIKKLKQLIEALPPMPKKVLELNKLRGLNYAEIAETLKISKKTVESHMRTAFKKIRKGFDNAYLILNLIRKVFR
ncbi:RNA polymerase sigma factor [Aestuariivivens sediminis]|uniref:RNA polymerase sigma factor n=1 Tax=Aestuariivivens sediminis TaxID=2913557 RepID=UPI001F5AF019|nr:sigma-70 family RNA polymerase sigma factor [Aestuariivivens sediminis]